MNIKLPQELYELSQIFSKKAKLYLVGGAVRNHFLGLKTSDFDICSSLRLDEVMEILQGSKFYLRIKNALLETAIIYSEDISFEYATFRVEIYNDENSRVPKEIQFTQDIEQDSWRRDFTCNAIYFDIQDKKFLDFHNGLDDINQKKLKTIKPNITSFSEDSVRIFRFIKFSILGNFNASNQDYIDICTCAKHIRGLSPERKRQELENIFEVSNSKQLKEKTLLLLIKTELLKNLISLYFKKINFVAKEFEFTLQNQDKNFHIICLYIDIYDQVKNQTQYSTKEIISLLISGDIVLSKQEKNLLSKILNAIEYLNQEKNLTFFIFLNNEIIYNVLDILSICPRYQKNIQDIKSEIQKIKQNNLPLNLKGLKITFNDCKKLLKDSSDKQIKYTLNNCLIACQTKKIKNQYNELKTFILSKKD